MWSQHCQIFATAKFGEKKWQNLGPKRTFLVIFDN